MPTHYTVVCGACGHTERRYRNVKRCRKCGGAVDRSEDGMDVHGNDTTPEWGACTHDGCREAALPRARDPFPGAVDTQHRAGADTQEVER